MLHERALERRAVSQLIRDRLRVFGAIRGNQEEQRRIRALVKQAREFGETYDASSCATTSVLR